MRQNESHISYSWSGDRMKHRLFLNRSRKKESKWMISDSIQVVWKGVSQLTELHDNELA